MIQWCMFQIANIQKYNTFCLIFIYLFLNTIFNKWFPFMSEINTHLCIYSFIQKYKFI